MNDQVLSDTDFAAINVCVFFRLSLMKAVTTDGMWITATSYSNQHSVITAVTRAGKKHQTQNEKHNINLVDILFWV